MTYLSAYKVKTTVTLDKPYSSNYSYEISATILSSQVDNQMISYIPVDGNNFELYISKSDSPYDQGVDIPVAWIAIGR